MPYNLEIPGWMPLIDLQVLERLAQGVPINGIIVEVGSFKGRSSWTLANSCDPSVTVYCIDLWDEYWKGKEPGSDPHTLQLFKKNVEECPNIIPLMGGSTEVDWPEERKADLIFIDGDHTSPQVDKDLEVWVQRLKPGGILAGHDFNVYRWPDVCRAVIRLSEKMKLPFKMFGKGFIWAIELDPARSSGDGWIPNEVLLDWMKESLY